MGCRWICSLVGVVIEDKCARSQDMVDGLYDNQEVAEAEVVPMDRVGAFRAVSRVMTLLRLVPNVR